MSEREVILKSGQRPTATKPHTPYEPVARRKLDNPLWQAHTWRLLDSGDTLLTGGVPNAGPKAKRWKGISDQQCVVTKEEAAREIDRYERETGKCSDCGGCGEKVFGFGVVAKPGASLMDRNGYQRGVTRYRIRACHRCNATGNAAPAKAQLENPHASGLASQGEAP